MSEEIKKLKKSIEGFDKIIADPNTAPSLKSAMTSAKKNAESKLAELEKKGGATEKKEDDATSAPTGKKRGRKPGSGKKTEEKKSEKKEDPEFVTITVKGEKKTYNINECEQAIAAAHARKERDKESGKKTKSKSVAKKAEDRIILAAEGITDIIPEKLKESEPKLVIKALEKFENEQAKSVITFCQTIGVSKSLTDKLAKAYETAIDPIIEEIKQEIASKKKDA